MKLLSYSFSKSKFDLLQQPVSVYLVEWTLWWATSYGRIPVKVPTNSDKSQQRKHEKTFRKKL